MTAEQKRSQLAKLAKRILDEDLDLALRVMMDFAIHALNEENKKRGSISCSLTPPGGFAGTSSPSR